MSDYEDSPKGALGVLVDYLAPEYLDQVVQGLRDGTYEWQPGAIDGEWGLIATRTNLAAYVAFTTNGEVIEGDQG